MGQLRFATQYGQFNDSDYLGPRKKVLEMASDLTAQVLEALSHSGGPLLSADVFPSVSSTTVKSALDRLGSREMVLYKAIDREEALLTPEAEGIAADGSHEAKVFEAVRNAVQGLKIVDLPVRWLNCMPVRLDDTIKTR